MGLGDIFTTVGRWVSGDDPNKRARAEETAQQKEWDKEASRVFDYEYDIYNANRENYANERDYAYETAVTNWEYGKKIQDYNYAKSLAAYEKSYDIYGKQLGYNAEASKLAINDGAAAIQDLELSQAFQREAMHADLMGEIKRGGIKKLEQGARLYGIQSNRRVNSGAIQQNLNELTKQNTFEKEAKFVEGLQKSGKAALGQAGVSRKKTLQSTAAQSFRNLVALDASLSGSRNKAAVDLLKLQVESSLQETQAGLNLDSIELGINTAKEEVAYNNRILDANLKSFINQTGRNLQQIQLQRTAADLQAEANLNLFPEEFDYAPEPKITPERIFVEPIKREAATVPKGPRVATGFESVLDVVGDVADIAGTVMGGIGTFNDIFNKVPSLGGGFDAGKTVLGAGGGSVGGVGTFGPNFGFPASN
jgi:hypothetical protein